MPANGTRLRLNRMSARRCSSVWSDSRLPSLSATRTMTRATMSRTPKRIPAMAAARRLRQKRAVSMRGSLVVLN